MYANIIHDQIQQRRMVRDSLPRPVDKSIFIQLKVGFETEAQSVN
jgi:hypothetical protein